MRKRYVTVEGVRCEVVEGPERLERGVAYSDIVVDVTRPVAIGGDRSHLCLTPDGEMLFLAYVPFGGTPFVSCAHEYSGMVSSAAVEAHLRRLAKELADA